MNNQIPAPGIYRYGTPFDKGFVEKSEETSDAEAAWYYIPPQNVRNYKKTSIQCGCVAIIAFAAAMIFASVMSTNRHKDIWITGYVLSGLSLVVMALATFKACQASRRYHEETNPRLLA